MDMQSKSAPSLISLLPDGKVENSIRVDKELVIGICTVYVSRSDDENEFLLRESGVAAIAETANLTDAVRLATDAAYTAAISRIAGMDLSSLPQPENPPVQTKSENRRAKPAPGLKQEKAPAADETPQNSKSQEPEGHTDADGNKPEPDEAVEKSPAPSGETTPPPVLLDSILAAPQTPEPTIPTPLYWNPVRTGKPI